jgi:hypothetical protein
MYCPQCGTESPSTLQYCRLCGANLKVIGKAVALSETIARSDRGPIPKLKEMMRNLTPESVTEEISGALHKLNEEIARSAEGPRPKPRPWWREKKSAARRREDQRVKGSISFFSGIGLTLFLYKLAGAVVLKLPPDVIAKIPFELEPVIRAAWALGFVPMLSGIGHLTASFFIKSDPAPQLISPVTQLASPTNELTPADRPVASVTEGTTNLLTNTPE